jgi:hypothetical protein
VSFMLRVSLFALALILSLNCPVFSQFQSSSVVLNSSQAPAETAVRALVEKYFALYAAKDLDGLMSLWSRQSPDYLVTRQAMEKQFETQTAVPSRLTISRLKIEDKRASLRLAIELTTANQQNKPPSHEVRNLSLICDAHGWKLWQNASSFEELAAVLGKTAPKPRKDLPQTGPP